MSAVTQQALLMYGGVATPASNTFIGSAVDTSNQATTYTFSTQGIGAADGTRRVIVGWAGFGSAGARSLSSATIAGTSATIHVNISSIDTSGFFSTLIPTGTTATIVLVFTGAMGNCGIGIWRQINETSSTVHATATDITISASALSASLNIPNNGCLYAVTKFTTITAPPITAWTNATERYDGSIEGTADQHSGASETGLATETPRTVTATFSGSGLSGSLSLMSWQ